MNKQTAKRQKAPFGLRLSDEVEPLLREMAKDNNRSLTAEINYWLSYVVRNKGSKRVQQ